MTAIPRLEAPLVLAHGLLGFSRLEIGSFTLASYFKRVPELLTAAGNRVVQTKVPPLGSIRERAAALKCEINDKLGEERVHIIAHSMGGLDSRHMITHLDMAPRVLSLTTLGTPHHGTIFADEGMAFAQKYKIHQGLRALGMPDEAFKDLSTERCQEFNLMTPNDPGVRYFSVAGDKKRNEMLLALRLSHDVIAPIEGPNDGLVSVKSAQWGESFKTWNCDHINLVGWVGPLEQMFGYGYDVEEGYRELIEQLAIAGF